MREILFRGKSVDDHEWVYGYVVSVADLSHATIYVPQDPKECDWATLPFLVDPDTVGQFTGLHDKYGNKIFEGDIVAVFYDCKIQFDGVVQYSNGAFVIKGYSMECLTRENMIFTIECTKWDKPNWSTLELCK